MKMKTTVELASFLPFAISFEHEIIKEEEQEKKARMDHEITKMKKHEKERGLNQKNRTSGCSGKSPACFVFALVLPLLFRSFALSPLS